jgi:crotonobetaine/carnitine-CoA ligase
VVDTFRSAVEEAPDELFLDFSGVQFTYRELDAAVDRVARGLRALGVGRGDRVGVMLDNGPDAVLAWFAANQLGAVNVPVNTAYKGEFLRHQLKDSGCAVCIVEGDFVSRLESVQDGLPDLRHLVHRGAGDHPAPAGVTLTRLNDIRLDGAPLETIDLTGSDLATLLYTSGTTGRSKGCRCTHNYIVDQGVRLIDVSRRTPDEPTSTPLPLFHIFGIATVVSTAHLRATAALSPRFSVSGFWPEVERTGARVVNLLGSMAVMIANAPDTSESIACRGQIRALLAVPMSAELKQTWRMRFGVKYAGMNAYGQTEAGSMITSDIAEEMPAGACGSRNDTLEVRVFAGDGTECEAGVSGEVVVRPLKPNVMFDGYWGQPSRDPAQWHRTGDLGKFDEDGRFFFVDRKADYLRRRGENISSIEIETALLQHPDVAEAAVHAVRSEVSEDEVKATLVRAPGSQLTAEVLITWTIERVPYFAVPRFVEFRTELPKNPVGRVLKYQLRDDGVTAATWDRETRPSS